MSERWSRAKAGVPSKQDDKTVGKPLLQAVANSIKETAKSSNRVNAVLKNDKEEYKNNAPTINEFPDNIADSMTQAAFWSLAGQSYLEKVPQPMIPIIALTGITSLLGNSVTQNPNTMAKIVGFAHNVDKAIRVGAGPAVAVGLDKYGETGNAKYAVKEGIKNGVLSNIPRAGEKFNSKVDKDIGSFLLNILSTLGDYASSEKGKKEYATGD